MTNKAFFLDRDGTLNVEKHHLYRSEDLEWIEGTFEALQKIQDLGYKIIVITNQAGVAKGLYREEDVHILHEHMNKVLKEKGIIVDAFYYCPHHPQGSVEKYVIECNCRKPKPGMILQAIRDFNLDVKDCILVGDKEIDIQSGLNAGIDQCYLVRSGHEIDESITNAHAVYDYLLDLITKLFF